MSMLNNASLHKSVFSLAFPMVISNITVPLLGLVDAAVIGHLEHAWYLGGVALGSSMISVLFWLLGFLRMSTTGITAQAWGAKNGQILVNTFLQASILALAFSLLILSMHSPVLDIIFYFSDASTEVKKYAEQYGNIRVWSAPAALLNLVVMGWLLGTQNAKKPMILVVVVNALNILLDLILVVAFDLKVQGVATATVVADYCGMLLGLYFVSQRFIKHALHKELLAWQQTFFGLKNLIVLNRDIFLRSLCLQAAFVFMTFQAANISDTVVAANVVLMNFLLVISFAMDGFAYAMEAMVGKAIGEQNRHSLAESLLVTTFWSLVLSLLITVVFVLFGNDIIDQITS